MAHSDEVREQALADYLEHGTAEAARRNDLPPRTIRHWANQANLASARTQALEKAGEVLAETHAKMREEFRVMLMERQMDALERMDQSHTEYKAAGSDMHKLTHETATSGDMRNYASIVKDLNGVYRLEMGETTSRIHTRLDTESEVDSELRRTIAEWQQQHQTSPDTP